MWNSFVLLGRETLFKDLGGIQLKWMTKTNELEVTFGQWKNPILIQLAIPQSATDINSSEETADIQMTEMVDKEEENILTYVFTNILEEEKSRQEVNDQDDRE